MPILTFKIYQVLEYSVEGKKIQNQNKHCIQQRNQDLRYKEIFRPSNAFIWYITPFRHNKYETPF